MLETAVEIGSILLQDLILLDCEPFHNKEDLFNYMAAQFERSGIVSDKQAFKQSLDDREALGPTYMGNAIAIPHGKCKEVLRPGVGFIRCKDSFEYESGGERGMVKYIFVLAVSSEQQNNEHLRILATLAGYLMKDEFRDLISQVKSYQELMDGIRRLEAAQ